MNIEQWFKEGDYETGLRIYASIPKANRNILSRLQRGETPKNRATLKYELNKLKKYALSDIKPVKPIVPKQTIKKQESSSTTITQALKEANGKVTMAMLPDPNLRKRFVEKNQAFYKRWELKWQLNNLPAEKEDEALQLIIEIMSLTKFIDSVWLEIDYFLEHKKVLPSSTADYSKLSALAKVKERQKLWSRKSKREATLKKWLSEMEGIKDKPKRNQLQSKIDKQKEVIAQMQIDIKTLTELIDG